MVGAVPRLTSAERVCPRCRYDLRGLPTPRCPECGLTFPHDEWQRGELREHVPARLDCCDPWQPHAVMWAGLRDLLHTLVRPRWVFTQLTPDGPRWVPAAMLATGLLWVYLATALGGAVALTLHAGVSPYAAGKAGLLWWAPRMVLCAAALAGTAPLCVIAALALRGPRPQPRVIGRVLAFWVPGVTACLALTATCIYLLSIELDDSWGLFMALLPCAYAVHMLRNWARARRPLLLLLVLLPVSVLLAAVLDGCWPRTLEPPTWIYF
jgi:hypothetical protein